MKQRQHATDNRSVAFEMGPVREAVPLDIRKGVEAIRTLVTEDDFGSAPCVCEQTGSVLRALAIATAAPAIVEVGTGYGISSIWLASAARATQGHLVSYEPQEAKLDIARLGAAAAGLLSYVTFVATPVTVNTILEPVFPRQAFVFIDGPKQEYASWLAAFVQNLKAGATLTFDNLLSHRSELGQFCSAIRQFEQTHRLTSAVVSVGAGLMICRID